MARSSNIGAATTLQLPMQHKSVNIARQNGKVHTTAPGFSRFNKILRVYIRCPAVITPNAHMHVIHMNVHRTITCIQCSFKLMRVGCCIQSLETMSLNRNLGRLIGR